MLNSAYRDQGVTPLIKARITFHRELQDDANNIRPDKLDDGYWPSPEKDNAGYLGDNATSEDFTLAWAAAEDRMQAWEKNVWRYIGVRARAIIEIPCGKSVVTYQLLSPGVWGIESDSGESYLNGVYNEEIEEMALHFTMLQGGFDMVRK